MQSIETELMDDFERIVLETLVPLAVQRQVPEIRTLWRRTMATKDGETALSEAFKKLLRSRRSVGESIRLWIADGDQNMMYLKNDLYRRIGDSDSAMVAFFGRPITEGNEQCPYWDGYRYTQRPPKGEAGVP